MEFKPGWSKEVSFNYVIILFLDGVDTNTLHNIAQYNLPVDNAKRIQSEEHRERESELDQFNITAQRNTTLYAPCFVTWRHDFPFCWSTLLRGCRIIWFNQWRLSRATSRSGDSSAHCLIELCSQQTAYYFTILTVSSHANGKGRSEWR